MKRIIIITASILLLALIIYIGVQLLTGETTTVPTPGTDPVVKGEPIIEEQLALVANEAPILTYWLNSVENLIYYITNDGEIYKVRAPQVSERVSGTKIQELASADPSADGASLIVRFGGTTNQSFSIFTVATKKWVSLPAGTAGAAWDPASSSQLAYLTTPGTNGGIYLFKVPSEESVKLASLNSTGLDLVWSSPDEIYLTDKPARESTGSVWAFTLSTKTFRPIITDKAGLMTSWSGDGSLGLQFSLPSVSQLSVVLINARGESIGALPFITLPGKCTFAGLNNSPATKLYCGVPYDMQLPRLGLPDSYLQHQLYTTDDIYEVGLSGLNSPKKIFTGIYREAPLDIDQPLLVGTTLYFLNRYDQALYSVDLRLVK